MEHEHLPNRTIQWKLWTAVLHYCDVLVIVCLLSEGLATLVCWFICYESQLAFLYIFLKSRSVIVTHRLDVASSYLCVAPALLEPFFPLTIFAQIVKKFRRVGTYYSSFKVGLLQSGSLCLIAQIFKGQKDPVFALSQPNCTGIIIRK